MRSGPHAPPGFPLATAVQAPLAWEDRARLTPRLFAGVVALVSVVTRPVSGLRCLAKVGTIYRWLIGAFWASWVVLWLIAQHR